MLHARREALRQRYAGTDVPPPPHWTGYRIVPDTIEFWTQRDHRLHERERFTRTRRGWRSTRLQP